MPKPAKAAKPALPKVKSRSLLARGLTWKRSKATPKSDDDGIVLETTAGSVYAEAERWNGTQQAGDGSAFNHAYKLEEHLGEGGYGVVHRITRKSDGAEFAAKAIAKQVATEWAAALEEAAVWTAVSSPYHPAILPLFAVYEEPSSRLTLVTELMAHGELTDAVFNVEMSEQVGSNFALGATQAQAFCMQHLAASIG